MVRTVDSWIESYVEYTKGMGSPSIYCTWGAIGAISAMLERKVWIRTGKGILFPNTYIVLAGEPGVGKTVQSDIIREMWERLDDESNSTPCIAVTSVTHASIVDELFDAERKLVMPTEMPPVVSFNSLAILVNELGVLLPVYDTTLMAKLTDLYDCKSYGERRRSRDLKLKIAAPQLNILAAGTPAKLNNLLPDGAWDEGFLSRVVFVYSGEVIKSNLWDENVPKANSSKLRRNLEDTLEHISKLYGEITFEDAAKTAINEWHMQDGPPKPTHPRLKNYCTRRTAHLLKLCQNVSISRRDDLVVTLDDYHEALDYLLSAEATMPDIFKAMTSGGDSQVIREASHFVLEMYMNNGQYKAVAQNLIMEFITDRTSAMNAKYILQAMISIKAIKLESTSPAGDLYIPTGNQFT